jgi:hypothetical protein
VGRLADVDQHWREVIGESILAMAKRLSTTWPADELDFRRACAAVEILGFDKHMAALGRAYGDYADERVQKVARRIYQRARALFLDRLDLQARDLRERRPTISERVRAVEGERRTAEEETRRQLARWDLSWPPEKGEPFVAPQRIVLGLAGQPFDRCATPIKEMDSFWLTESFPYTVEVSRGEDGGPIGTIQVSRREGRRQKSLLVDVTALEMELADGTTVSLASGQIARDGQLDTQVQITREDAQVRVNLKVPAWPDGIIIILPSVASNS